MINNLIPFVLVGYFLFFLKNNHLNNVLTSLIFVSFFAFSTNYTDFKLDFDIFRYLHRTIGVLVVIALVLHIFKHRINVFKEPVIRILALFFLVLLLSFIGNEIYVKDYVHYVRNFIFISSIVVYLYYMIDSRVKIEELFNLIIAITVILSCFMVLEVIQYGFSIGDWGFGRKGVRKSLNFGNANYLAYALFPGFVLTVFSKKSYIMWFFAPLVIFAIFATESKSVYLSSIFVIFLYVYQRLNKKFYLILVLLGISTIFLSLYNQIVTNKNFSSTRYVIAKIALNVFQEHPINGMGYGQFKTKFYHYIDQDTLRIADKEITEAFFANNPNSSLFENTKYEGMSQSDKQNIIDLSGKDKMTHNDLLTVIAELGLIGLAFLFFLFYKLYLELEKLLLHDREYFFLSIGLIGGSLIFSMFHNNLTSFVFWFVIFIPFIMNRNNKKQLKV